MNSGAVFSPADGAARWTQGLLLVILILSLVGIVSGCLELALISRASTGEVTEAEAAANDSRQAVVGILQLLAALGQAIAFLTWFYRVRRNLITLGGRDFKYSPGWTIGGFFVPFLNLVRPLQVMREVWHGSDPAGFERDRAPNGPEIRNQLGTPSLVGFWWGLVFLSTFVGQIALRLSLQKDPTLSQLQLASTMLVIGDTLDIPTTLVAIALVKWITSWQAQRHTLAIGGVLPSSLEPSFVS